MHPVSPPFSHTATLPASFSSQPSFRATNIFILRSDLERSRQDRRPLHRERLCCQGASQEQRRLLPPWRRQEQFELHTLENVDSHTLGRHLYPCSRSTAEEGHQARVRYSCAEGENCVCVSVSSVFGGVRPVLPTFFRRESGCSLPLLLLIVYMFSCRFRELAGWCCSLRPTAVL